MWGCFGPALSDEVEASSREDGRRNASSHPEIPPQHGTGGAVGILHSAPMVFERGRSWWRSVQNDQLECFYVKRMSIYEIGRGSQRLMCGYLNSSIILSRACLGGRTTDCGRVARGSSVTWSTSMKLAVLVLT